MFFHIFLMALALFFWWWSSRRIVPGRGQRLASSGAELRKEGHLGWCTGHRWSVCLGSYEGYMMVCKWNATMQTIRVITNIYIYMYNIQILSTINMSGFLLLLLLLLLLSWCFTVSHQSFDQLYWRAIKWGCLPISYWLNFGSWLTWDVYWSGGSSYDVWCKPFLAMFWCSRRLIHPDSWFASEKQIEQNRALAIG
jgi:hypothetical protein